jgi:rhodanese-related sulfurtransferase
VLERGLDSGLALSPWPTVPAPVLPGVDVALVATQMAAGDVLVIDIRPSMQFRKAHIPGSLWSIRPLFRESLAGERRPVVLVGDDAGVLAGAAIELKDLGLRAQVLTGGLAAWRDAGLAVQATPDSPPDRACIDYLFFVHDRHDGNKQAARQYLAWETDLIAQLDPQELQSFRLPVSPL